MRKFLSILIFNLLIIFSTFIVSASPVVTVYFHYYRFDNDYTSWDLWCWQSLPSSEEGAGFNFVEDTTDIKYNFGGKVAIVNLEGNLSESTKLGFIIRKGGSSWLEKDIDSDRFVTINNNTEDGTQHIYIVQGEQMIGNSLNDPNCPSKSHKFTTGYFINQNTIKFEATSSFSKDDISLEIDGVKTSFSKIVIENNCGTITLDSNVILNKKYELVGNFNEVSRYTVTFDGIYDSKEFEDEFAYLENDLGAIATDEKTTFKLWAPISDKVELNIYDIGTPVGYKNGSNEHKTYQMNKEAKGIFSIEFNENLHNKYYTYTVYNGSSVNEVVDPYAKGCGINGIRGLVVDFSKVNPEGFTYNNRPNNITNMTDAIIYELHIRDLTSSSTWNGSKENKKRYLGLCESGTKYNGLTTGFDHIKELGVTHVQILPFYDYGNAVDESKVDENGYVENFNWGYMPLNYNCLEGAYSSNPYDGLVRIREMKTVVSEYAQANIRINMDVVYNHTGLTADSNFNLIVPGYYHRKLENGSFSNGSGCGNETASERVMMQKFMIDSLVFWANEYNISGFRFDLMAIHDTETMQKIADTLKAIDPTIMVYGEPWTGGTVALTSSLQASKTNLRNINGVGAFNDDIRDGIKGSVFQKEGPGFVQGVTTSQTINKVKYGIVGGIEFDSLVASSLSNGSVWHTSPDKTINYTTCHDNNTLYDKLYLSNTDKSINNLKKQSMQANAIVLTSQGISFIHAGDEFLRSKPDGKGGFDSNSYQSNDSVNQIDWSLKEKYFDVYNYYKGLINLRKSNDLFRMTNPNDIKNSLKFIYTDNKNVIAYTIKNNENNILVIHSNGKTKITLPEGDYWNLIVDGEKAGTEVLKTYLGKTKLTLNANDTIVLYQGEMILEPTIPSKISIGVIYLAVGLVAAGVVFYLKKRS